MRLEAAAEEVEVEVGGELGGGPPSPLEGTSNTESACLGPGANNSACSQNVTKILWFSVLSLGSHATLKSTSLDPK